MKKVIAQRIVSVGLWVFAVGCAASSAPPNDNGPNTVAREATITEFGEPLVSGCDVSRTFDVVAPSTQSLGFIAVRGEGLKDMSLSLFSVGADGSQTAVSVAAQELSGAMAALLNQASADATALSSQNAASQGAASRESVTSETSGSSTNTSKTSRSSGVDATSAEHQGHRDQETTATNGGVRSGSSGAATTLKDGTPAPARGERALAFTDLEGRDLGHARVVVHSAADGPNEATTLFTGAGQNVLATGAFSLDLAGCSAP
jgi:hypothetical protein